jgi:tRNA pseudouridine13 synthase
MKFTPSVEDFVVEEIPLPGAPSGAGPHVWAEVEKRGIATLEAIRRLSVRLAVPAARIGHAGLKDAHARTTQWLSFEAVPPAALEAIADPEMRVLRVSAHDRKLGLGASEGNRFTVRLRDAFPDDEAAARAALDRMARDGVPNFFGAQRFGIRGLGARIGKALLLNEHRLALDWLLGCPRPVEGDRLRRARDRYERGDLAGALDDLPPTFGPERTALAVLARGGRPVEAVAALPWKTRELYLNAYQSDLFNRLLAGRVAAGTLATIEEGDVSVPDAWGARSPAGPLFGWAIERARGEPGAREEAVLRAEGIGYETFRRSDGLDLRGVRRSYRVPVRDVSLERESPSALLLRFALPPGAYATTLVDELLRAATAR